MGNKKICYITNGRVFKSDEIAEEKKYLRGIWIFSEIDQYERKCVCKKKQTHLIRLYKSRVVTL